MIIVPAKSCCCMEDLGFAAVAVPSSEHPPTTTPWEQIRILEATSGRKTFMSTFDQTYFLDRYLDEVHFDHTVDGGQMLT